MRLWSFRNYLAQSLKLAWLQLLLSLFELLFCCHAQFCWAKFILISPTLPWVWDVNKQTRQNLSGLMHIYMQHHVGECFYFWVCLTLWSLKDENQRGGNRENAITVTPACKVKLFKGSLGAEVCTGTSKPSLFLLSSEGLSGTTLREMTQAVITDLLENNIMHTCFSCVLWLGVKEYHVHLSVSYRRLASLQVFIYYQRIKRDRVSNCQS